MVDMQAGLESLERCKARFQEDVEAIKLELGSYKSWVLSAEEKIANRERDIAEVENSIAYVKSAIQIKQSKDEG